MVLKSVIASVLAFLTLIGCFWVFQREQALIVNQAQLASVISQQEQRINGIEQYLTQKAKQS